MVVCGGTPLVPLPGTPPPPGPHSPAPSTAGPPRDHEPQHPTMHTRHTQGRTLNQPRGDTNEREGRTPTQRARTPVVFATQTMACAQKAASTKVCSTRWFCHHGLCKAPLVYLGCLGGRLHRREVRCLTSHVHPRSPSRVTHVH